MTDKSIINQFCFENEESDMKVLKTAKKFYCYWITSGNSSYIGATVDPRKRLRQHCGICTGGARRTRGKLWTFELVISGFRTWKEALQFEWSFKFYSKRCRSIESRKNALETLLNRERWTSNSPLAVEVPLHFEWKPQSYGMPSEIETSTSIITSNSFKTKTKTKKPKKTNSNSKFKKNLLGVRY